MVFERAFSGCSSLSAFVVSGDNPRYAARDGVLDGEGWIDTINIPNNPSHAFHRAYVNEQLRKKPGEHRILYPSGDHYMELVGKTIAQHENDYIYTLRIRYISLNPNQQEQKLADGLQEMDLMIPYASEREKLRDEENNKLRERVLTLLAQDRGTPNPIIPESENKRLSKEEYDEKKRQYLDKISALLDKLAQQPQPGPAQVRNYAMACRPQGVRLAWQCNYKHALHSSPCGCAKPQMGGKWVILGNNSRKEIKDDI